MEYAYGLQEMVNVVDVPYFEERGFGSFGQIGGESNHLHLPTAISQWSTTDPAIFHVNDQAAWTSSRVRMHGQPTSTTAGGGNVYDMCVQSSTSSQHVMNHVSQSMNNCQQLIPLDTQQQLLNNVNNSSSWDPNFSVGENMISIPLVHQMLVNHFMTQERCTSDQMPQLISDFSAQQPCLYTSSSECPHDADSSGSSGARDYALPSSALTGCSSEEIKWRNSDVVHGNFAASSAGFPLEELYDDSSSVAPMGHVDIADTQHAQSTSSSLSLVMQRNNANALISRTPTVSWALSGTESDSSAGAMAVNHCSTLDPLLNIASLQDISGPSSCPPPYKRARLSYNSVENTSSMPSSLPTTSGTTSGTTRPLVSSSCSSFGHHRNMMGVGSSDYPMTTLNVADALYRDLHFSSRQQMPGASLHQQGPSSCIIQEISGGGPGRYGSRKDPMMAEHESSRTTSNRKQNATSIEPQSVAARHRRKKISERVRVLEKLIPGGNKMDTASMLDEAIEYVKFLQLQVGLLEKLGELPEGSNNNNVSNSRSQQQQASNSSCLTSNGSAGGGGGASSPTYHGSSSVSRPTPTMPVRPTTSPLILSEILQQQLFKQKLCLVSLRQYPSGASPSGSYA